MTLRVAHARSRGFHRAIDRKSTLGDGSALALRVRCGPLNKRRAAKPAVYFGLQCHPGLAGRQPRIECYNLRSAMARQIMVAPMSQRARLICIGCDVRCGTASTQMFGFSNHFVHPRGPAMQRMAHAVLEGARACKYSRPRADTVIECAPNVFRAYLNASACAAPPPVRRAALRVRRLCRCPPCVPAP
jgi:hypothetical protein